MMRLKLLVIPVVTLMTLGCQSNEHSGSKTTEDLTGPDTTILVHRGNQKWGLRIPKMDVAYFSDLQTLLDTLHSSPDTGSIEIRADITGEGYPQRCLSTWKLNDSGVVLRRFVISRQGLIWNDSMALSDEHAYFQGWDQDSSYFDMKPYSTVFVAEKELEGFIGDSVDQRILESGTPRDYLLKYHSLAYWRKYFSGFKGRAINTIGMEPKSFIWDKGLHRFILLSAP